MLAPNSSAAKPSTNGADHRVAHHQRAALGDGAGDRAADGRHERKAILRRLPSVAATTPMPKPIPPPYIAPDSRLPSLPVLSAAVTLGGWHARHWIGLERHRCPDAAARAAAVPALGLHLLDLGLASLFQQLVDLVADARQQVVALAHPLQQLARVGRGLRIARAAAQLAHQRALFLVVEAGGAVDLLGDAAEIGQRRRRRRRQRVGQRLRLRQGLQRARQVDGARSCPACDSRRTGSATAWAAAGWARRRRRSGSAGSACRAQRRNCIRWNRRPSAANPATAPS